MDSERVFGCTAAAVAQTALHSGLLASIWQLCKNAASASVGSSVFQFGRLSQDAGSRRPRSGSGAAVTGGSGSGDIATGAVAIGAVQTVHISHTAHLGADVVGKGNGGLLAQLVSKATPAIKIEMRKCM